MLTRRQAITEALNLLKNVIGFTDETVMIYAGLEVLSLDDKGETVEAFRKNLNNLINPKNPSRPRQIVALYDVIYYSLLAASITKPINNEDLVTLETPHDIAKENLFYLSDGYFFRDSTIIDWVKTRKILQNPYLPNSPMHYKDKLALIELGNKFNLDLEDIKPSDYKVEEHPAILIGAIQSIERADQSIGRRPTSLFNTTSTFITELANITGKSTEFLVAYQQRRPFRFSTIASASSFIVKGLISFDQIDSMSIAQKENIDRLLAKNPSEEEFTQSYRLIIQNVKPRR